MTDEVGQFLTNTGLQPLFDSHPATTGPGFPLTGDEIRAAIAQIEQMPAQVMGLERFVDHLGGFVDRERAREVLGVDPQPEARVYVEGDAVGIPIYGLEINTDYNVVYDRGYNRGTLTFPGLGDTLIEFDTIPNYQDFWAIGNPRPFNLGLTWDAELPWYEEAGREEKKAAEQRAHDLLLSLLTPLQRKQYDEHKAFIAVGNEGGKYLLKEDAYSPFGMVCGEFGTYCMQSATAIPHADKLISWKLWIEGNEDGFRTTANACRAWDSWDRREEALWDRLCRETPDRKMKRKRRGVPGFLSL